MYGFSPDISVSSRSPKHGSLGTLNHLLGVNVVFGHSVVLLWTIRLSRGTLLLPDGCWVNSFPPLPWKKVWKNENRLLILVAVRE